MGISFGSYFSFNWKNDADVLCSVPTSILSFFCLENMMWARDMAYKFGYFHYSWSAQIHYNTLQGELKPPSLLEWITVENAAPKTPVSDA